MRASGVGDGGDDLPPHADAAADVVRGGVADDQPEARRLGAGAAAGAGARVLPDGVGDAAPLPLGDGPSRPRAPCAAGSRSTRHTSAGLRAVCSAGRPTRSRSSRSRSRSRTPRVSGGFDCSRVEDVSKDSLIPFIESAVEPGATVHTDGWQAYWTVPDHGYEHERTIMRAQHDPAHVVMPGVHRVASLLKRWLLGTHQGSVGPEHLDAYLNEFTFRFNRRGSRRRGLLFYRLLEQVDPRRPDHIPKPDRQPTPRTPTTNAANPLPGTPARREAVARPNLTQIDTPLRGRPVSSMKGRVLSRGGWPFLTLVCGMVW